MKQCNKCFRHKDESEFYKNRNECIECHKERNRQYRIKNADTIKEYRDLNRVDNNSKRRNISKEKRDERNAKRKEDRANNKERERENNKKYNKKYKSRIDEHNKKYYREHKEEKKTYNKNYKKENQEFLREQKKQWMREQRKTNPYYRFVDNLRSRISQAFKRHSKYGKANTCKEYGIDFEAIFKRIGACPGSGKEYHLDHIIPLSLFDLDNPEHVRLSHVPENLQWLPSDKNNDKHDKITTQAMYDIKLLQILILINADISHHPILQLLSPLQ